jgi:hypothetical protein
MQRDRMPIFAAVRELHRGAFTVLGCSGVGATSPRGTGSGRAESSIPNGKHRSFQNFGWRLAGGLSLLKFSAFIWGRTDFPRICEELVLGASEKLPNILAPLFTLIKYHPWRNYLKKARNAEKPKSRCEGDVCRDIGTRSQPEKPMPAM